ncbi:MAG: ectoine/hydroxyectoine ABC transporter permease subunit EhuC [Trueperaceae bacterium]|nr:ectoine/hydroxyectoine ABC transporter permease subunit EhuC [Trueperaceae bacterium]
MSFDLLPLLLRGARITLLLTLAGATLALLMSLVAGLARMSTNRVVRSIAATYVEVFRGTSVLVQMFWFYFALPLFGISLSAFTAGTLALGLNVGAYGAEVVRGAIQAVPKGQTEAAIALNMSPRLRMRRVVLPQAFAMMLPPFGNLLIELLKATALVSLITLPDLTFQAMSLRMTTGRTTEIFVWLLVLYFVIAYPLTLLVRWLEHRVTAYTKA